MERDKSLEKKLFLGMFFLALLVSFSFQGTRGLYETSEGRYAECAREMLETGQYMDPTLGYRPHFTKPPLSYWAIAGGIKILGPSEWGVRLYNAVAFFFTCLVVALIGTTLWDRTTGLLAGLVYATSPFPVSGAWAVTTDTLLTLWEVSAVLCYVKAVRGRGPGNRSRWVTAMWVLFGLGFLTKGPPALLPMLPILAWHFLKRPAVRLADPPGIILFALVAFFWYVAVSFRHPGLLSYFLGHEVIDRISSNSMHNHEWYKPFTIYLPMLTLGAGPWLYWGLKTIWRKRLIYPGVLWSYIRNASSSSFLLMWLILPLIVFFLVKSRLRLYVLPLYAPLALAVARGFSTRWWGRDFFPKVAVTALVTALVLVGVKGIASYYPNKNNMRPLYEMCRRASGPGSQFFAFNMPKLFGLQYYLNGRLKRVSISGGEQWADDSVVAALGKIKAGSTASPHVFISDKSQSLSLYRILKESGLSFERLEGRYWILFSVR